MVVLLGFFGWNRINSVFKILVAIFLVNISSDLVALYLASVKTVSNTYVYHFSVIILFWLYSYLFYQLYNSGSKIKSYVMLVPAIFTIFCIVLSYYYEKLSEFPSINIIVSSVLIVVYCLFKLNQLINENPEKELRRDKHFLLICSILTYFTLTAFVFGLVNIIMKTSYSVLPLILFINVATLVFYTIVLYMIYQEMRLSNE